ncbi:MAG: HAD-IIIC family phosphatase [Bacteroidota bacterium]
MSIPTFQQLKRHLKQKADSLPTIKMAVLGNWATQLYSQALEGYAASQGYELDLFEGDYDQMDLQIQSPDSALYAARPDVVVLHLSSQKLRQSYWAAFGAEKSYVLADRYLQKFDQYLQLLKTRLECQVIVSTLVELPDPVFGNYAGQTNVSWGYQVRKFNLGLMDLAAVHDHAFLLDTAALHHHAGFKSAHDPQVWINAAIPFSLDFLPILAKNTMDIVLTKKGKFKKCLILDLDHTTWGGVIGDDGIEGIQVGQLGLGKAFTELQSWAKALKARGIILGICSKNTESVAKVPFEAHPEMTLRLEDISIFVANWENKADNLRYIQQVLNIGMDSIVFLDDNPFERNLVRDQLPDITVPELPEDPALYLDFVSSLNLFETASYASEDAGRTEKYRQEAARRALQQQFNSIDDYLGSLGMQATFRDFDTFHVPRIAQLTQRSNQYNLRTIRYDEAGIRSLMDNPGKAGYYVRLQDTYGDYGLISVLILEKQEEGYFIDTWLMSCRVLKRGVEFLVLNELVRLTKEAGLPYLIGEYLATPKNKLVEQHYADLGFEARDGRWYLDIASYQPREHFIELKPEKTS